MARATPAPARRILSLSCHKTRWGVSGRQHTHRTRSSRGILGESGPICSLSKPTARRCSRPCAGRWDGARRVRGAWAHADVGDGVLWTGCASVAVAVGQGTATRIFILEGTVEMTQRVFGHALRTTETDHVRHGRRPPADLFVLVLLSFSHKPASVHGQGATPEAFRPLHPPGAPRGRPSRPWQCHRRQVAVGARRG